MSTMNARFEAIARFWLLPLAVTGMLLGGTTSTEETGPPPEEANLTILTWNIKMLPRAFGMFTEKVKAGQDLRTPWIINHLEQHDYDIVVLQEVFDPAIERKLAAALVDNYPHQIEPKRGESKFRETNGVMILSTIPLEYITHNVFEGLKGFDALSQKGVVLVAGERDGVRFQLAGTHMQAGHQELREPHFNQIRDEILKPYGKEGVPQFLVGDLNTRAGTDKFDLLLETTDMQWFPIDDPEPYTSDAKNTWNPPDKDSKHIDHVLLNPRGTETTIVDQEILREKRKHEGRMVDLSDHYGLIAHIALRR